MKYSPKLPQRTHAKKEISNLFKICSALHGDMQKPLEIIGSVLLTVTLMHLWTADLHVSSRMDVRYVLCVASPDTVGAFPIRQDITVLPADDPKKLRLGWVIYEEVGVAIINDYSISLITLTGSTT